MKSLLKFFQMTLVGGLLFLVPVVVLVIVIGKGLQIADKIVEPLAELLPVKSLIGLQTPLVLAILLLVVCCFLFGLFARTALAERIVTALEEGLLVNLPGYSFIKSVGQSLLGAKPTHEYPPVLAYFDEAWHIAFLTERISGDRVVVFLPDSPHAGSGVVQILKAQCITPINKPPAAAFKCLSRMGVGIGALLAEAPTTTLSLCENGVTI